MSGSTFEYRAVDGQGTAYRGELTCASRVAALEALTRQGLTPVELLEQGNAAGARGESSYPGRKTIASAVLGRLHVGARLSRRQLLSLTQSLASLLHAGLTIDRALQISIALMPPTPARAMTQSLLESVRAGHTLSASFAASGQRLPSYYLGMIEAGEVGGSLPGTLGRLGELIRKQIEVRERIHSALVYPMMLALVILATLVILLSFVLPRFESLFAETDAPLPFSTRAVLAGGRLLADDWPFLLAAAVGLVGASIAWLRSEYGRERFDRWLLTSRWVLGLPAATNTARLLRTVSTLCENGSTLPVALRIARGTVENRWLLNALTEVGRGVQAGEAFSLCMARSAVFPHVVVQLARVGEETGRFHEMLLSAAVVLEEDTQRRLERLLTLVVPLITIAMGMLVAGLIGSVLIGLLSINDLAF